MTLQNTPPCTILQAPEGMTGFAAVCGLLLNVGYTKWGVVPLPTFLSHIWSAVDI